MRRIRAMVADAKPVVLTGVGRSLGDPAVRRHTERYGLGDATEPIWDTRLGVPRLLQ